MQTRRSTGAEDDVAVSSVVGTVLMLAITVTVFAGIAIGVLQYFEAGEAPIHADLSVVDAGAGTLLKHRGGDPLRLADVQLRYTLDGVPVQVMMDDMRISSQTNDGTHWRVGDRVCIVGVQPPCLHAAGSVLEGLQVLTATSQLLSHGEGPSGGGTGSDTDPDLSVTFDSISPDPGEKGDAVTFTATVTNDGAAAAGQFTVSFLLDGVEVTSGIVTSLNPLQSTVVTGSPAWLAEPGRYLATVKADSLAEVTEGDESNNVAKYSQIFVVSDPADPGQPFEDADNDGVYDPAVDSLIDPAEVLDGSYDAGTNGLVIPASTGPISATGIEFTSAGNIHIQVELVAGNQGTRIEASGSINITGMRIANDRGNPTHDLRAGTYIDASNSTLIGKQVSLTAGTYILANDGAFTSTTGDLKLTAGTNIKAMRATLTASLDDISQLGGPSPTLYIQDATIVDRDDLLHVLPSGTNIVGSPASGGIE